MRVVPKMVSHLGLVQGNLPLVNWGSDSYRPFPRVRVPMQMLTKVSASELSI
jgi:hypothetical protein